MITAFFKGVFRTALSSNATAILLAIAAGVCARENETGFLLQLHSILRFFRWVFVPSLSWRMNVTRKHFKEEARNEQNGGKRQCGNVVWW
jgi:hypothetical protein